MAAARISILSRRGIFTPASRRAAERSIRESALERRGGL
jgi:hypothetical protein